MEPHNAASTKEQGNDSPSHSRVLRRSRQDRMLAGVCGGLGEYLGIQAVWVRVGFVLLALASFGWGVLAYVLMALAIPKSRLGEPYRSIPTDHEGTKLVGLALIALGGIFLFNLLVPIELALKFIAPLILIGVGLAIVMRRER